MPSYQREALYATDGRTVIQADGHVAIEAPR